MNETDPKHLFREVKKLISGPSKSPLPLCRDDQELAERFSKFFADKVDAIRMGLDSVTDMYVESEDPHCASALNEFALISEKSIRMLIDKSPAKSSKLDPIPTTLLKSCMDGIIPTILQIINSSLSSGIVPDGLKSAVITPLLKKPSLDPEDLKNFRPVSNLKYISKLLERVVANQLQDYLNDNNLHEPMQSAYRVNHGVEYALLKVYNDCLTALDTGKEVALILLDLSAAFDTIDHELLLGRMKSRFGITGNVLAWLESYMTSRSQYVDINGSCSQRRPLTYGVPQGSVLGPLLFTLYTAPLGDLIRSYGLDFVLYADDTQLFITVEKDANDKISQLEACISGIKDWMLHNKLKLNDSKTEVIYLSSSRRESCLQGTSVHIGKTDVIPSSSVKDLGVTLDQHLLMADHVTALVRKAAMGLRYISKIRGYLDKPATERLVHAFVTSHLDSCNSLLLGIPSYQLQKLQRIQNAAARIVCRTKRRNHISPIMYSLHWLPVAARVEYKVLLIVFKCLTNRAPVYLENLIHIKHNTRALRSSNQTQLTEPRFSTKSYGARAFSVAAPRLWNSLPCDIRETAMIGSFKSKLKTFLFKKSYNH